MTDNIIQIRALGKTVWGITEREPNPRSSANTAHVWRRLTFKAGKDNSGRKQARDLRRLALLKRNEKQIQNLQMASAAKVKADETK